MTRDRPPADSSPLGDFRGPTRIGAQSRRRPAGWRRVIELGLIWRRMVLDACSTHSSKMMRASTREDLNRFERARFRRGTWLALPFATVHIEYPGCTPSGWRRGFVANCAPTWRWSAVVTVNSRCWSTGTQWLMAAPWPPWACSLQGGKCSMPFGPNSSDNRMPGEVLPARAQSRRG